MAVTFRTDFNLKDAHSCEALVLTCMDFRFQKQNHLFISDHMGIKTYDSVSVPGACWYINHGGDNGLLLKSMALAVELHNVSKIILINHEDCKTYDGSARFSGDREAEFSFHAKELTKAHRKIKDAVKVDDVQLAYSRMLKDTDMLEYLMVP